MNKFYHARQNNVHGEFIIDSARGLGQNIVVEAKSVKQANTIFRQITAGFNDYCSCCGSRFETIFDKEDGYNRPHVYGETVDTFTDGSDGDGYIHYLNGEIKSFK